MSLGSDDVGEGDREGADGSSDVAGAACFVGNAVGFLFGEFDGLDIELVDEILKLGVVEDFLVEKFRVFFPAGFAGIFDEEF